MLEELDIGREWYFDNRSQTLYYKPNATTGSEAGAAPSGVFEATNLKVLLNVSGSQAAPGAPKHASGLSSGAP